MTVYIHSGGSADFNDDASEKYRYQGSYGTGSFRGSESSYFRYSIKKLTSYFKQSTLKEYDGSKISSGTYIGQGSHQGSAHGANNDTYDEDNDSNDAGKKSKSSKRAPKPKKSLKPRAKSDVMYPRDLIAKNKVEASPSSAQSSSSTSSSSNVVDFEDQSVPQPSQHSINKAPAENSQEKIDFVKSSNHPDPIEEQKLKMEQLKQYDNFSFADHLKAKTLGGEQIVSIDPTYVQDNETVNISVSDSNKSLWNSRINSHDSLIKDRYDDIMKGFVEKGKTPKVLKIKPELHHKIKLKNSQALSTKSKSNSNSKSDPTTSVSTAPSKTVVTSKEPMVAKKTIVDHGSKDDKPLPLGKRVVQIKNFTSFVGLKSVIAQISGGPLEKIIIHPLEDSSNIKITDLTSYINLKNCILELWFLKIEDAERFIEYSCSGMFLVNGFHYTVQWAQPHRVLNGFKYHIPPSKTTVHEMLENGARRCLIIKNKYQVKKAKSSSRHYPSPKSHYSDINFEEMRRDFRQFGEILEVTPVISRRLCIAIHYFNVESAIRAKRAVDDENSLLYEKYIDWGTWYGKDPAEKPCINI